MNSYEVFVKTKQSQFKVLSARMIYDVVLYLEVNKIQEGEYLIHVIGENSDDWLNEEEFNTKIVGML